MREREPASKRAKKVDVQIEWWATRTQNKNVVVKIESTYKVYDHVDSIVFYIHI